MSDRPTEDLLEGILTLDPYPLYRRVRDSGALVRSEQLDCWVLSRFDDVQAAARDWRSLSSATGIDLDGEVDRMFGPGVFIASDPPRHDELRRALRSWFTPRAISELQGQVASEVDVLISAALEKGTADLAKDLAWALPVSVVSALLGIPRSDRPLLQRLVLTVESRSEDGNQRGRSLQAAEELRSYLEAALAIRRRSTRITSEDILSRLARRDVPPDDAIGMAYLVMVAGIETTAGLIGGAIRALSMVPDQRMRLREDPSLMPRAIEELLRYVSPIQGLIRTAAIDAEVGGETISQGDTVLLLYGSANHDERRFTDPDELNLERLIPRHLAFGDGIHFCLGAPLARLEAAAALSGLLRRAPEWSLAGEPARLPNPTAWGLLSLPVNLEPLPQYH